MKLKWAHLRLLAVPRRHRGSGEPEDFGASPVRNARTEYLRRHNTRPLYPAGEEVGYVGKFLSTGADGLHIIEAVARDIVRDGARQHAPATLVVGPSR